MIPDWGVFFLDLSFLCSASPPSSWSLRALLCRAFSFTFFIFFPFPLRAPKSKLLLLLRAGLCKSNLCNRIVMLSTSVCSPRSAPNVFARVQSQVFRFTLLTSCLHCVSGRERERERDIGEITQAVTVRMGLSIRAAKCAHHRSQVGRLLYTFSWPDNKQGRTAQSFGFGSFRLTLASYKCPRVQLDEVALGQADQRLVSRGKWLVIISDACTWYTMRSTFIDLVISYSKCGSVVRSYIFSSVHHLLW